ncbi:universal stress protein [Paractinoplanes rhizophilus]|uniref:Universal stress protein n=1 Tax=Paractinoplanes rhizophilus TaxID=1416877 RepID=A0ABW2HKC1_9ACTN|nr:universal stress protein [Actinoplanes sp.]
MKDSLTEAVAAGRGALRGMLQGSVSQHLLRQAACPVAIAHEAKD